MEIPKCCVGSFREETACPNVPTHFVVLFPGTSPELTDTGWHSLKVLCDEHRSTWTSDKYHTVVERPVARLERFLATHVINWWGREGWDHGMRVLALTPEQVKAVLRARGHKKLTSYLAACGGGVFTHTNGFWEGRRYTIDRAGHTTEIDCRRA